MLQIASTADLISRLRASTTLDPAKHPSFTVAVRDSAEQLTRDLSSLSGAEVSVAVDEIVPAHDDAVLAGKASHIRCEYQLQPSNALCIVGLERVALDGLVDVFFGGSGCTHSHGAERDVTRLELTIAQRITGLVIASLQLSLGSIAPFTAEPQTDGVVTDPREALSGPWLRIRYRVRCMECTADLLVFLPLSALQGLRTSERRSKTTPVATDTADPVWTEAMRAELGRTALTVRAMLSETGITLGDLAQLRPGALLPLRSNAASEVALVCGDLTVMTGALGQRDGAYTVKIGSPRKSGGTLIDAESGNASNDRQHE